MQQGSKRHRKDWVNDSVEQLQVMGKAKSVHALNGVFNSGHGGRKKS